MSVSVTNLFESVIFELQSRFMYRYNVLLPTRATVTASDKFVKLALFFYKV